MDAAAVMRWPSTRREVKKMEVLRIILIVLEVLASVALIAVVLLQSGKEAGLLHQVDRSGMGSAGPVSEPGVI